MRVALLFSILFSLQAHAFPVAGKPPAEMQRVAQDLHERWGAVIRALGVTLDQ